MKVELQSGDTIAIPEGCKAIVKDGIVTIQKDVQEFKDGDVLVSVYNECMVIFAKYNSACSFKSHYNEGYGKDASFNNDAFRHATEEEKQLLFDKMKEEGLRWNAEEKRVENIRWRAKKGERYYSADGFDASVMSNFEADDRIDYILWRSFNYFRTGEQAEEAARRMKETLRKYHEETGE